MIKYTEFAHAINLLRALSNPEICNRCVVPLGAMPSFFTIEEFRSTYCIICKGFVNLSGVSTNYACACPCRQLGEKECIKRTWLALEEKGYLD